MCQRVLNGEQQQLMPTNDPQLRLQQHALRKQPVHEPRHQHLLKLVPHLAVTLIKHNVLTVHLSLHELAPKHTQWGDHNQLGLRPTEQKQLIVLGVRLKLPAERHQRRLRLRLRGVRLKEQRQ